MVLYFLFYLMIGEIDGFSSDLFQVGNNKLVWWSRKFSWLAVFKFSQIIMWNCIISTLRTSIRLEKFKQLGKFINLKNLRFQWPKPCMTVTNYSIFLWCINSGIFAESSHFISKYIHILFISRNTWFAILPKMTTDQPFFWSVFKNSIL
jgi:hypothetical protein